MSDKSTSFREGSTQANSIEVGHIRVINATFPPHATLERHQHERAGCSVVLEGAIEKDFAGKTCASPASSVVIMPPQEQHKARFARDGARILVIEPALDADQTFDPFTEVFGRIHNFQDARMTRMAWQICNELKEPDPVTPLAIEGLVLALLARATRHHDGHNEKPSPPPWLIRAREYLQDTFSTNVRISDVAQIVGIHPVHLARVFREHHGLSPGEYLRQVRLEWATTKLLSTRRPIGDIAQEAGFADQSHFTRTFKRHVGLTPGQYRRQVRN